jgi:hypothetical protein
MVKFLKKIRLLLLRFAHTAGGVSFLDSYHSQPI